MVATSDAVARVRYVSLLTTEWPEGPLLRRANNGALCPVEVYPSPNVRDGALRRQNRVLIWIDGHIPPRVIEFFLTDWIQGHRIG